MAEKLKLQTNHTPTLFNEEMLLGAALGIFAPIPLVGAFIAGAAGAAIGGFVGKNRQEQENRNGKWVNSEGSFWNKDTLIGGLVGLCVGKIVGAGILLAAVSSAGTLTAVLSPLVLGGVLASIVGGTILGAYVGGAQGVRKQHQEYEIALGQHIAHERGISPAREPEMVVQPEPSISYQQRIDQERAILKQRAAQAHI